MLGDYPVELLVQGIQVLLLLGGSTTSVDDLLGVIHQLAYSVDTLGLVYGRELAGVIELDDGVELRVVAEQAYLYVLCLPIRSLALPVVALVGIAYFEPIDAASDMPYAYLLGGEGGGLRVVIP